MLEEEGAWVEEMERCTSYLLETMGGVLTHAGKCLVMRVGRSRWILDVVAAPQSPLTSPPLSIGISI